MFKSKILFLGLMISAFELHSFGCESLAITITNVSDYPCELKRATAIDGTFATQVPSTIPASTTSDIFYVSQNGIAGITAEFYYQCNDKRVTFESKQGYCGFATAGLIKGHAFIGNDLTAEHNEIMGSYWSDIPGKIDWKIS